MRVMMAEELQFYQVPLLAIRHGLRDTDLQRKLAAARERGFDEPAVTAERGSDDGDGDRAALRGQ